MHPEPHTLACTLAKKDAEDKLLAQSELKELGFTTTPVTVIDDGVIVGFDVPKLDEALARNQQSSMS